LKTIRRMIDQMVLSVWLWSYSFHFETREAWGMKRVIKSAWYVIVLLMLLSGCINDRSATPSETVSGAGLTHAEVDDFAGTKAEDPAETEVDDFAGTKAEDPAETEADGHAETKAQELTETEADGFAGTKTEDPAEAETDGHAETKAQELTETETDDSVENKTEGSAEMQSDVPEEAADFVLISDVVPDAILEIRYYSTYNFVGDRIDGYEEPVALFTKEAAEALKEVSDELAEQGYRLKIFDAYRPVKAVDHFVEWAKDPEDIRMKAFFYPELEKSVLFPRGYISVNSSHSRGSAIDLTLFDMTTEKEVDMGGTFDYFGELSHPSYKGITEEQYENRMLLRNVMKKHGFKPITTEWWHFTFANEPYPNTYFDFPVNSRSVGK